MNKLASSLLFVTSLFVGGTLWSAPSAMALDELTYVVNNEATTYDPGVSSETFAAPIIGNTFEGLVRFNEDGGVEPALAEKWRISGDGLTYTFTIRDAKWSDGKPIKAGDFAYAWRRVLDPATGAKNAPVLFLIEGAKEYFAAGGEGEVSIDAPNNKTLTFTLAQRVPHMLQILTYTSFFPVRKDIVEADPEGWARNPATYIGTGPFRVTEFNFGRSTVMEKNPEYFGAKDVKLDKLTFLLMAEPTKALAAMEAGEVDGIERVPEMEIPRVSIESKAFLTVPTLGTTYAFFNPGRAPFQDVRVRKALSMGIDRDEIMNFVLQTADVPAIALVPFGMNIAGEDFRDGTSNFDLSLSAKVKQAQALLANAGYPDGEGFPKVVFSTYTSPPINKLVAAIQQMWKRNLNIDVEIESQDWTSYFPEVQKIEHQIAQMGWGADYPHPMTFLDNFVSGNPNNFAGWSSAEYDAAIVAAKQSSDEKVALAQMRKAEAILMNAHIIIPQYHRNNYMMMSTRAKGFWRSTLGAPYFRDVRMVGE